MEEKKRLKTSKTFPYGGIMGDFFCYSVYFLNSLSMSLFLYFLKNYHTSGLFTKRFQLPVCGWQDAERHTESEKHTGGVCRPGPGQAGWDPGRWSCCWGEVPTGTNLRGSSRVSASYRRFGKRAYPLISNSISRNLPYSYSHTCVQSLGEEYL